jgi:hypothetical protein
MLDFIREEELRIAQEEEEDEIRQLMNIKV